MEKRVVRLVLISVLAHELGHAFGLNDEYNSILANKKGSPNPLSIEYECDPNPTCEGTTCCCGFTITKLGIPALPECKDKSYVCCLGNKNDAGGRSIMSFLDPPNEYDMEPRAFERSCLNRIKGSAGLNCE